MFEAKIIEISVYIDPINVPNVENCHLCGQGPVEKIPRVYRSNFGGDIYFINTEPVPGYNCRNCGGMDGVFDTMTVGLPMDKAELAELEKLIIAPGYQELLKEHIALLERNN